MAFLVATTSLPAVYRPNGYARTTTAGTPHARANNLDGVVKNNGLQSTPSDNPDCQISMIDGESSCQVTQGNADQISVANTKPANKQF